VEDKEDVMKVIRELEELLDSKELEIPIEKLNVYQREALGKILRKYFRDSKVSNIVQMPTGTGKTILAAAVILALWLMNRNKEDKLFVLFLAPRSVIRFQAYVTFMNIIRKISKGNVRIYLEDNSASFCRDVSLISGKYHKLPNFTTGFQKYRLNGLVIVITPQLLMSVSKNRTSCFTNIVNNIDALILDEVHTYYIGEETRKIIEDVFRNSKRLQMTLGLTATPVKESIELVGDLIYQKHSRDAMDKGLLTPLLRIICYRTWLSNIKIIESNANDYKDEWRLAIVERAKEYANRILEIIGSLMNDEQLERFPKVLVMAPNITEADLIHEQLQSLLNDYYKNVKVLKAHSKLADEKPHKIIDHFKKLKSGILITVNMADIGFDDPDLEVLVIARPLNNPVSYVQIRGRVLRKAKVTDNIKNMLGYALIIDLVSQPGKSALEHEKLVEEVERGVVPKKEFIKALSELRGVGEVPKARAIVNVKYSKEAVIGDISKIIFSMYRIIRTDNGIIIRRDRNRTFEEYHIADTLMHSNSEKYRTVIKEIINKYLDRDFEYITRKYHRVIRSREEILDKSVEKIIKYSLSLIAAKKNQLTEDLAEDDVISNALTNVLRYGKSELIMGNRKICLLLITKKNRKYIKAYIKGGGKIKIRVRRNVTKMKEILMKFLKNKVM
jgi:superfamily II DNA or RNA helicase